MSEKVIKSKHVYIVNKPISPQSRFLRSLAIDGSKLSPGSSKTSLPRGVGSGSDGALVQTQKKGYEQGFAEGVAFQKNEACKAMHTMSQVMNEMSLLKSRLYAEAEGDMLKMIFAIAAKVIRDEVSTNEAVVLKVLREAVKLAVDKDGMKIRINPRDLNVMREIKEDFVQELDGKNIIFEGDAGIKPGGAILETTAGEVDARLESQLNELEAALTVS